MSNAPHQAPEARRAHFRWRSGLSSFLEKPLSDKDSLSVRTKTDTGWRGEDPKALERTLVKELGKLTP